MFILLFVLASSSSLPYFYHTTQEVLQEVKNMKCSNLQVLEENSIHAIKLGPDTGCKGFFIFGEHPRELISVELALYLIETLCDDDSLQVQLIIILNANPAARERVENGEFCLRTNNNGVDLNRNWGAYWEKTSCTGPKQTCSGPEAYSEAETKKMQELFEDFQPWLFISVHSGVSTLMYPYAYTFDQIEDETRNELESVLKKVKSDAGLSGEVGQVSLLLDYLSSGNCLDYAFSRKVTYAFAFEIYAEKSRSALQISMESNDDVCFSIFNPQTHHDYLETLEKWTNAIKATVGQVCQ